VLSQQGEEGEMVVVENSPIKRRGGDAEMTCRF
jgi:hypothetical protein